MNKKWVVFIAVVAVLVAALAIACDVPKTPVAISSADNVLNKVYDSTTTALRTNITGTALITSPVANPIYARLVSGSDVTGTVVVTSTVGNPVYARLVSGSDVTGTVIVTSTVANPVYARIGTGSSVMGQVGIDQTTPGTTNLVSAELITRTQQNPLITAGAYGAGDAVGNILTFTSASRTVGQGGTILSVVLQDSDKESAGLELWLFDTTFTQVADNAVFDVPDVSIPNCIGVISISSEDYNTGNDWGLATVRNVNLPYSCVAGTSIYGQLKCTATPTFGNTRDLTVTLVLRWN